MEAPGGCTHRITGIAALGRTVLFRPRPLRELGTMEQPKNLPFSE
jgi:hypothetical protein